MLQDKQLTKWNIQKKVFVCSGIYNQLTEPRFIGRNFLLQVGFLKEVGQKLSEVSPRGLNGSYSVKNLVTVHFHE